MGEKWNILDYEHFNDGLIVALWDNGENQAFTKREILAIARLGKELFPDELEFRGPEITDYGCYWNMKKYCEYCANDIDATFEAAKAIINNPTVEARFSPKKVIFHDPATIVYWADGTKTVVKCQEGDTYSKETGLALCFMKKACGNNARFNNMMRNCIYDAYLHQGGELNEDD